MAKFLLIHGSCHGAWCWRDVIPALKARGHDVSAIDLPSHGADTTPYQEVTLDAYADAITAAMGDDTILVGHSMAGYPITAAAEKAPQKIARLVYLCAYVPAAGKSLVDLRIAAPRQPLLHAIEKTRDGLGFAVKPEAATGVFYQDCPSEAAQFAISNLCVQAIAPQATAIPLSARSQDLPRSYIRCTDDQTIPPEYQLTMTADWPRRDVHHMDCGHSPFFAMPEALAALLDQISKG